MSIFFTHLFFRFIALPIKGCHYFYAFFFIYWYKVTASPEDLREDVFFDDEIKLLILLGDFLILLGQHKIAGSNYGLVFETKQAHIHNLFGGD